jgi:fumarate reductase subunit D
VWLILGSTLVETLIEIIVNVLLLLTSLRRETPLDLLSVLGLVIVALGFRFLGALHRALLDATCSLHSSVHAVDLGVHGCKVHVDVPQSVEYALVLRDLRCGWLLLLLFFFTSLVVTP